jgi:hypothetical protein
VVPRRTGNVTLCEGPKRVEMEYGRLGGLKVSGVLGVVACAGEDAPPRQSDVRSTGDNWHRRLTLILNIGARGFEPPTLCSQSRCSTRLSYAPTGPGMVAASRRGATQYIGLRRKFVCPQRLIGGRPSAKTASSDPSASGRPPGGVAMGCKVLGTTSAVHFGHRLPPSVPLRSPAARQPARLGQTSEV